MSLIGIKCHLVDSQIGYSQYARIFIYRAKSSVSDLNIIQIKESMTGVIKNVDFWWADRPFLLIAVDLKKEAELLSDFGLSRIVGPPDGQGGYLVDLIHHIGYSVLALSDSENSDVYIAKTIFLDDFSRFSVIDGQGTSTSKVL